MSREQFFKIYLRQSRKGIGIFFLFCAVFLCIFLLYDLPAGAVVYPALICSVFGAGVLARGYYSAYQKHRELDRIAQLSSELMEHFPEKKLVSATGMAGYGSSNTIRTQKLMKNFYLCGDRETAPTYGNGLMAPRVAICAAHEANMITRLILGEEDV